MFNDARDRVKRSPYWALLRLQNAAMYNQKIAPGRRSFEPLHADGFVNHDGFLTPLGQTLATTMGTHPEWRPCAGRARA